MDRATDISAAPPVSSAVRDCLKTLIRFDTTSHRSNLALVEHVRDFLATHGVTAKLFYNSERSKANLYATIGPPHRSGYVLSGHTDVVPVLGQDWSVEPWEGVEKDGRIYGRGACDMKGFIAAALAQVPHMVRAQLDRPIHFCFSYDEEIGCVGVRSLLAFLSEQPVRPRGCVVGEPTGMRIVSAHKGKLSVHCRVRGHACHSSLAPRGVNAVEAAARMVVFISDLAERTGVEGPFDHAFDIPFTTIQTGVIRGGSVLNIVPSECEFEFEIRHRPGDDPYAYLQEIQRYAFDRLQPQMQHRGPSTGFEFEERSRFVGLDTDPDHEIVRLALRLAGETGLSKVAFGTEGGGYDAIGIPTVVCGPGNIEQAHKPDEFVSLEQLALCERFIGRLIETLSSPPTPEKNVGQP